MRGPTLSPFRDGVSYGKIEYIHSSSHECSTAYNLGERAVMRIYVPRSVALFRCYLTLKSDMGEICIYDFDYVSTEEGFDLYDCRINTEKIGVGLYFFEIVGDSFFGRIYGRNDKGRLRLSDSNDYEDFQLTVSDFKYKQCEDALGGVIYHVFVDRFNKGGKSIPHADEVLCDFKDGIPEYPEFPGAHLKNNCFYGGTIFGITEKLDYIKSLGVKVIYLSPIFEARSNHKYDTADYMTVDSFFGGDEALKELISKARDMGIGIILDGVFNHTGSDSIYFNKEGRYNSLGAYQSKSSPYFSWYDFKDYPDNYVSWWGIEILPRIHPDKSECGDYFVKEGGVIDKYSRMGVLGFRLDVADELSDGFIAKIKDRLNENNGSSLLFGEVWEDASNKIAYGTRKKYYLGCELDGVMNYPLRRGIIDYIKYKETAQLDYALGTVTFNAPRRIRNTQMNILGTHDTERIITVLGGESSHGKSNSYLKDKRMSVDEKNTAVKLLKSAYTLLATVPGIPSVFYGDEVGLEGYSDPFNRMPYPWGEENRELLEHYRKLGSIRSQNAVYKDGAFKVILMERELLIFKRTQFKFDYLTVYNNSDNDIDISFDCISRNLLTDEKYSSSEVLGLGARCAAIFKVRKNSSLILRNKDKT